MVKALSATRGLAPGGLGTRQTFYRAPENVTLQIPKTSAWPCLQILQRAAKGRSGSSRRPDFGPIRGDFQRRFSPKRSPPPPNPDEVCYVILDIASLRVTATFHSRFVIDDIPFHNNNFPSIAKRFSQFCLSCFWVSLFSVRIATEIRSKGRFANILNWHVGMEPRIKSTRFS